MPAPLSDELIKLWTLLPAELELRTDSKLDMAEEQDSLSPLLKLRKNLFGFAVATVDAAPCIFRPSKGALGRGAG